MRPVKEDKGGPGLYPYNLDYDYTQETWEFRRQDIIDYFSGDANPTIATCLEVWLDYSKRDKNQKKGQLAAAAGLIAEHAGDTYTTAGPRLVNNLHPYCSYCETYLPGQIQVEHVAPKAEFPLFCLAWENFLPLCGPCNTAKGNKPYRATILAQFFNGVEPGSERAYYDKIRAEYFWADTDTGAYIDLLPRLEYFSQSLQWRPVPQRSAVNLAVTMASQDYATRTVIALFPAPLQREVRVVIDTNVSASGRTVDLCQLNEDGDLEKSYDYRLFNRTKAWLYILADLNDVMNGAQDQASFDRRWQTVLRNAARGGFYTLWVRILDLAQLTDPSDALLVTRFVNETNVINFYPNTETSRIPGP